MDRFIFKYLKFNLLLLSWLRPPGPTEGGIFKQDEVL
ncbi:hypothetical protein FH603_3211 [Spirosoma sp. LMG 31447]|uniref:Uncharacterized protein n=1 Tax=Spirosoma utsteinense TaxID=2585773 RepID=A0ABR6W7Y7_9BACT|nr:hypothetical protein [Spirosoma utsteinense]